MSFFPSYVGKFSNKSLYFFNTKCTHLVICMDIIKPKNYFESRQQDHRNVTTTCNFKVLIEIYLFVFMVGGNPMETFFFLYSSIYITYFNIGMLSRIYSMYVCPLYFFVLYNGRILLTGGDVLYKIILPILRKSTSSLNHTSLFHCSREIRLRRSLLYVSVRGLLVLLGV